MQGLGELLRSEIRRRGINQQLAADVMGIRGPIVSRWLGPNPPRPSPESCAKLAQFLGMATVEVQRLAGYPVSDAEERARPALSMEQAAAVAQVERLIKEVPEEHLPQVTAAVEQMFAAFLTVWTPSLPRSRRRASGGSARGDPSRGFDSARWRHLRDLIPAS